MRFRTSRARFVGVVVLFLLSFLLPARLALPYGTLDWARFSSGYYPPPEFNLRINVGGPQYVDSDGDMWVADQAFAAGGWGYTGSASTVNTTTQPIDHTDDPFLYQSQRANMAGYSITLPNGRYRLTLGFAELQFPNNGQRIFNVAVEGQAWLVNYDIVDERGFLEAQEEHDDFNVGDGELTISFSSVLQQPVVNTIRIEMRSYGCGLDVNCSGSVNLADVQLTADGWGTGTTGTVSLAGDIDLDGDVDIVDLQRVVNAWGGA